MDDLVKGNRIIVQKKYKSSSVYMAEFPNNLYVVVATDNNGLPICSRTFPYTEQYQKEVKKTALNYFKLIKECIYQKKPMDEI